MADSRKISPAVFTQENDLSFLPQGIADIGAAVIGPMSKGPAFFPKIISSPEEFQKTFGDTTPDFYTPTAVINYLAEAKTVTAVRILGLNGYSSTVNNSFVLRLSGSTGAQTLALLHPSRVGVTIQSATVSGAPLSFTLVVSGASGLKTYSSMSISPTSPNYFASVLGTSPDASADAYAYAVYPNALNSVSG